MTEIEVWKERQKTEGSKKERDRRRRGKEGSRRATVDMKKGYKGEERERASWDDRQPREQ